MYTEGEHMCKQRGTDTERVNDLEVSCITQFPFRSVLTGMHNCFQVNALVLLKKISVSSLTLMMSNPTITK